jgi:hypothetical protein
MFVKLLARLRGADSKKLGKQTIPEPSEHYIERIKALDNVILECIYISKQYEGIPSPTSKHFYASILFTMLCTRGVSLLILAPHSTWAQKVIEHWDYASLAGMVRSILEIRLAFFIHAQRK